MPSDKVESMPKSDHCKKGKGCAEEPHTGPSICHRSKSPQLLLIYVLILSTIILGFDERFVSVLSTRILGRKRANIQHETTAILELPPLEELIARNGTIIGDISWMLDFAVIAFPKSVTTFMKDYLNQTKETFVFERELCMKHYSDITDFVKTYYDLHAKLKQPRYPKTIQFGLKCPGVLYRENDIHIYAKYFPRTKFIIGLRHPVSWFESFYNYQSYRNVSLPDTSQLIGRCTKHEKVHQKVCTDRARFHAALARLGKTPMEDGEEIDLLLGTRYDEHQQSIQQTNNDKNATIHQHGRYLEEENNGIPNHILLYEVQQIHDEEASKELSSSIQQYLGIEKDFPSISSYKQNKSRTINICDAKHENIRRVLVKHGADAEAWIHKYFLKSPGVEVASQNSFHHFLSDWSADPCSNGINASLHNDI